MMIDLPCRVVLASFRLVCAADSAGSTSTITSTDVLHCRKRRDTNDRRIYDCVPESTVSTRRNPIPPHINPQHCSTAVLMYNIRSTEYCCPFTSMRFAAVAALGWALPLATSVGQTYAYVACPQLPRFGRARPTVSGPRSLRCRAMSSLIEV